MKYWSPDEPTILRFPKPDGKESFEVSDSFIVEAAKVENIDGKNEVSQDEIKLQQVQTENQTRLDIQEQRLRDRAEAIANIDNIKSFDDVKEILKYLAGVK